MSKKFAALLLTCALATISSTMAFASTDVEAPVSIGTSTPIIVPFSSSVPLTATLNSSTGSQSNSFNTSTGEPFYKVWVENTSTHSYTVTVTKDSPSGATQATFTVAAGTQNEVRMNSSTGGVGTRYVNVTSTGGYALQGTVSVRIATTSSELG